MSVLPTDSSHDEQSEEWIWIKVYLYIYLKTHQLMKNASIEEGNHLHNNSELNFNLFTIRKSCIVVRIALEKKSRFPLIQSPFVKLTQLAKFDKPSEA